MFLYFISSQSYSQSDWVNYLLKKEKGYMSVSVDLDYNDFKPNYKNLLIVGKKYKNCLKNGFPNEDGLKELYVFSDSVAIKINRLTKNKLVGVLTYRCVGFDVYYVKDTSNIRKNISQLFSKDFSNSNTYIQIKKDNNWIYYFDNIFPENATNNFLINHQYLFDLVSKGDDLSDIRNVKHWIYFNNLKKRLQFKNQVESLKFTIDSINYKKEKKYPYELLLSRNDHINPKSISELTQILQLLAKSKNGIYDGWGTEGQIND